MPLTLKSPVPMPDIALVWPPLYPNEVAEVEAFLQRLSQKGFSPHTLRSYRTDLTKAIENSGRSLLRVSERELEAFLASEIRRGLHPTTIERRLNTLRSFYKDALRYKLIAEDPTLRLSAPKKPKKLRQWLSVDERATLLRRLPNQSRDDKRKAAIVATFYYTGIRLRELVDLTVERAQGPVLRVMGKGQVERDIPIGSQLRAILDAWLAVHPTGTGALFTSLGTDPGGLHDQQIRAIVKDTFKQVGLGDRKYTPITLRHTFATRMVERGVRLDLVRQLLGHVDINTTMGYVHTAVRLEVEDYLDD